MLLFVCKYAFLLCLCSVAMVVLLGDGIESLLPSVDLMSIRIASFVVLTPMLFLPIRKLAYTSLIGIVSCACLVTIVIYDGLSKKEKPGSLLDPMVSTQIATKSTKHLTPSLGNRGDTLRDIQHTFELWFNDVRICRTCSISSHLP